MKIYEKEISRSLDEETSDYAAIKSYISYVNKLPTGKEEGNFLALDFGSTTVRILLLQLNEETSQVKIQTFEIPQKLMTGKSEKLFDFLAKCLSDFLKVVKLKMLRIPLGVTFGFPIEQISLQDCRLIRWTKGFDCKDLVGENIFTKLKDSIRKYPELKRIYIIGILNETVSSLLSSTVEDPNCKIGVMIGHVSSCCYAERIPRISKYHAETFGEKYMYVTLDSSGFGEDGSLDEYRTDFDFQLDEGSEKPGALITEKMTSLSHIGEIARFALIRCIESGAILGGDLHEQLTEKGALTCAHMMRIESDPEKEHDECRSVLQEFGYDDVSDTDCIQVQFVCRCVSRRAAHLFAAQLAAIMNRINEPYVGIVLGGEMANDYPMFEWYLTRKLTKLKKEKYTIVKPEENGLGKGAAVMAAVFGEEVMDRDEKLRRLPGFPVTRCHFRKTGRCLNPDCNMRHPCDTSAVNPLSQPVQPQIEVLTEECFKQDHCKKKDPCAGYDQL